MCAPGEEALEGVDVEDGADLDYFDVEDLGRLRRSLRKAIGDTQRERELYQEIVQQYIEARAPQHLLILPLAQSTLISITSVLRHNQLPLADAKWFSIALSDLHHSMPKPQPNTISWSILEISVPPLVSRPGERMPDLPTLSSVTNVRVSWQVSDVLSNRLTRGKPFMSSSRAQQLPAALGHLEWWWRCVLRGWVYRWRVADVLLFIVQTVLMRAPLLEMMPMTTKTTEQPYLQ